MKFYLDNWRWQGVPFTFDGQRMQEKQSSIVIQFQPVPHSTFLLEGRHDAKPLNHKHSASNGYQATVYDKKNRFVTFVPAEMVLIIFLLIT
jgi:glucose-6-phosphate 1-dehydrogenase